MSLSRIVFEILCALISKLPSIVAWEEASGSAESSRADAAKVREDFAAIDKKLEELTKK